MAIVVATVANANAGSGTTIAVAKPASLAVGDLMVAVTAGYGGSSSAYSLSGWTAYNNSTLTTVGTGMYYTVLNKVADAGDVAASTFTFTGPNSNGHFGTILRLTGAKTVTPISTINSTTDITGNNPVFTDTITPTIASSLLVMFTASNNGTPGVSGYAIVTSNPSWTEQNDDSLGGQYLFALATATRPQTTATGNSSVTMTQAGRVGGAIFAVVPATIVSVADTQSTTETLQKSLQKQFADTQSTTDAVVKTKSRFWSRITKSISSWTDQTKDL